MFGLSVSGRLDSDYLSATIAELRHGEVGELMCHPGYFDPAEITDPRLRAYHDWEGEFAALTGDEFDRIRERENVQLIGYRHLGE